MKASSANMLSVIKGPKQLIKIVDLLGRDSEGLINQPLFYIFDDGTVDKKINTK